MIRIISIGFSLIFSALISGCSDNPKSVADAATNTQEASPQSSTTVYTNGNIITINDHQPTAEAVAVRDGKILAVGPLDKIISIAGSNPITKDLAGKTLLPGFIDAHGHLGLTLVTRAFANVQSPPVGPAKSIEDIVSIMKNHQDQHPDVPWLLGWGYDDSLLEEKKHPTRADLDAISKDIPIVLIHVSGHLLSCNSKCLQLADINAKTENPKGGVIRRDTHTGEPNGILEESATWMVHAILPQSSDEQWMALFKQTQQYYASYGITTVQEGATSVRDILKFRAAANDGILTLDLVAYPMLKSGDKLDSFIKKIQFSRTYQSHFRIGGIKLVLDGSPQGKTAWLTQPYHLPPAGLAADYKGYPILDDLEVTNFISDSYVQGVQVLAHTNGDAAADQLISALEAITKKQGRADRRTVMIHAQTVRDDQIDRMNHLSIVPSYFASHTFYWGDWHRDSVLGLERASRISPLRSSIDRKVRFTTHNDTPVVPPDMMRLIWAAVNRSTRSGQTLGEAQRISPLQALKSMTIDAAYQYFEEDRKGSIEPGKLADFVILSENPLSADPSTINNIQVLETIKEGVTIFRR